MAWGTTGLTEDSELKRVAAVRQYLYQQFPSSTIRDSYDPGRLAQVFRVELHSPPATYTLVISTEFLRTILQVGVEARSLIGMWPTICELPRKRKSRSQAMVSM